VIRLIACGTITRAAMIAFLSY